MQPLAKRILEADAFILITPEYNGSYSPHLKNLLDHFAKIYAEGSQFVVLFASKHYSAKAWTNHERKQAQAHSFKESKDFILPARFDDTEIPGLPATVAYIDLRSVLPGKFAELIIAKLRN